MDFEISHCAEVFREINAIPSAVSARILRGRHDNLLLVRSTWRSQDFVKFERNTFVRDYVIEKTNLNVLSTGIASDASSVSLQAFSKSGNFQAILQEKTKPEEKSFLEIWNTSKRVATFDMTDRKEHGKINVADPFKCFVWSSDEKYLLYTAEEKQPKSVSYFKDLSQNKEESEKSVKGAEYVYRQEWGEACVGCHHSVLCIFEIKTGLVEVLPIDKVISDISIGQAVWGPNDESIVFVGWKETPYRLGVYACENRKTQIYSINLKSKDIESLTDGDDICVRSPNFSPNFDALVYLENSAGGPHIKCAKLQKYDMNTKKVSTVVGIVENADGDDFPGIYAQILPSRCWSDDGKHVYFSSQWRSRLAMICVNINNGEIQKLDVGEEFGASSVLDVQHNLVITQVSSPSIEPCLVAGFLIAEEGKVTLEWKFLDGNAPIKHLDISWNITKLLPEVLDEKYCNLNYEIIIIKPTEKKEKSPLIVVPHGGPHSCFPAAFSFRHIGFVKLGYSLCLVNYRGSTGFGETRVNSLPGNVGSQDVSDVHNAALYLKSQKDLDFGDVFVNGGSHGGFLGAHLSGQYPDFYKAVSLHNPVIDISAMVSESDIPDWCWVEGGCGNNFDTASAVDPSHLARMWEKSPIAHVGKVRAPTLLVLGKKDLRVPITQGLKYYLLLKARNIPVKIYHYEDNHPLMKTPHDGDVFMQTALWFKKHSSS